MINRSKTIADFKVIQERCLDTSTIETEEATKHSLILPVLMALGYDVFNNNEVRPEYIADVGTKRGEKVDYVVLQNGQPTILIEVKQVGTPLRNKVDQLFRYFSVTPAKIAILTDGVKYLFFTDYLKANIMDTEPYMTIDMKIATESEFDRLLQYHKEHLNIGDVLDNIKYELFTEASKKFVDNLFEMRPDNWLVRKLADECQIGEQDFVKLAEILNNQVSTKIKSHKHKDTIECKNNKDINEVTNTLPLTDTRFKETKGLKLVGIKINGDTVKMENVSWKGVLTHLFKISVENVEVSEIVEKINKSNTRKYVYLDDCDESIKKECAFIENKGLYLYLRLGGKDIVKRSIEVCDVFGVIDKDTVEITYSVNM